MPSFAHTPVVLSRAPVVRRLQFVELLHAP
jgi:hypothetical protein